MPQSPATAALSIAQPMTRGEARRVLSDHTRDEIDRWLKRYPPEQRRSAVLAALREAQHQNDGYLTGELMNAVAAYLDLPPIWVYEAASFYSMFETRPVGRHSVSVCTNISCMLCGSDAIVARTSRRSSGSRWARAPPTAASTSSRRRNASPPAAGRR